MHPYPYRCLDCGALYPAHVGQCSTCFADGAVVLMGQRMRALVDTVPEVTSARDLMRASWQSVTSSAYPSLQLRRGALLVLEGPPGGGKSTMATRLLDGLRGPVVYASVEEPPGPSLAARLARARVTREDFVCVGRTTLDQLVALASDRRAVALAIDSVQPSDLTPRDLRHVLNVLPRLECLVAVAQVNARGLIAGARTLEHEADVVARVEGRAWCLTKSRYQDVGASGPVLATEGADNAA